MVGFSKVKLRSGSWWSWCDPMATCCVCAVDEHWVLAQQTVAVEAFPPMAIQKGSVTVL